MTRIYTENRSILARSGFLLLAGIFAAIPSVAQLKIGPITVGAGLRTSFDHTEPEGGDSTDKFLLDSVRLYVNGPVTDKNQVHVQHRLRRRQQNRRVGRGGAFRIPSEVQHLGRPFPAAERPREPLARTTPISGVCIRTASRTAIRSSSRAATTASSTGVTLPRR